MGRDALLWTGSVEARVSRHNTEQDKLDDAAWVELRIALDAAVDSVCSRPEYAEILGREPPPTFTPAAAAKIVRESFEVGKRCGMQLVREKHMHGYDVDRLVERLVGEGA